ncbi:MAG TPA: hypothetical protein VM577_14825 [Anaerovoracaceae bacterium]|nr:hypothetical protein [Anaerovoracaceae bacterium]
MITIIYILLLVCLTSWFLLDRYFFIKRTNKLYDNLMDEIHNKYKACFEEIAEQANKMEDARWDSVLVNACGDDQEKLRSKFPHGWSVATLNLELKSAALEYAEAFKSQAPLKEKVSRIVNLLFLFVLSKNDETQEELAVDKKLRLKNMN